MRPALHKVRVSWLALVMWPGRITARNIIDSTTPASAYTATPPNMSGYLHENLTLVMSDEFNVDVPLGGYSDKAYWNAETLEPDRVWQVTNQLSYDAGGDSYMSPRAVEARNGSLLIYGWKERHQGATYIGGQLTSWNRFCFQGGYLEVRYKNLGPWGGYGFWPAIWALGILLRDNFMIRNRNLWPYTYSDCQCPGSFFHGVGKPQAISACMPDPGYGLNPFQGRGAVEMDLLEQVTTMRASTWRPRMHAPSARPRKSAEGRRCTRPHAPSRMGPRSPRSISAIRDGVRWRAAASAGLDVRPRSGAMLQVQCSKYQTDISDSFGVVPGDSCLIQTFQVGPRLDYTWRPFIGAAPSAERVWCAHPPSTHPSTPKAVLHTRLRKLSGASTPASAVCDGWRLRWPPIGVRSARAPAGTAIRGRRPPSSPSSAHSSSTRASTASIRTTPSATWARRRRRAGLIGTSSACTSTSTSIARSTSGPTCR